MLQHLVKYTQLNDRHQHNTAVCLLFYKFYYLLMLLHSLERYMVILGKHAYHNAQIPCRKMLSDSLLLCYMFCNLLCLAIKENIC